MVKNVKNYIDSYAIFAPNIITFHYEALARDEEVMKTIEYAKTKCKSRVSNKTRNKCRKNKKVFTICTCHISYDSRAWKG